MGSSDGYVNSFPDILPGSFNRDEFVKDAELLKKFSEINTLISSLCEKVDDTYLAIGGEAMSSALDVYTYVQTASYTKPGLKTIAERLKERFKRQKAQTPAASVN